MPAQQPGHTQTDTRVKDTSHHTQPYTQAPTIHGRYMTRSKPHGMAEARLCRHDEYDGHATLHTKEVVDARCVVHAAHPKLLILSPRRSHLRLGAVEVGEGRWLQAGHGRQVLLLLTQHGDRRAHRHLCSDQEGWGEQQEERNNSASEVGLEHPWSSSNSTHSILSTLNGSVGAPYLLPVLDEDLGQVTVLLRLHLQRHRALSVTRMVVGSMTEHKYGHPQRSSAGRTPATTWRSGHGDD